MKTKIINKLLKMQNKKVVYQMPKLIGSNNTRSQVRFSDSTKSRNSKLGRKSQKLPNNPLSSSVRKSLEGSPNPFRTKPESPSAVNVKPVKRKPLTR